MTTDASGRADDFGALLATETAEATVPSSAPTSGTDIATPAEPIVTETLSEDVSGSAVPDTLVPIWLQLVPSPVPSTTSSESETAAAATTAPQPDIRQDIALAVANTNGSGPFGAANAKADDETVVDVVSTPTAGSDIAASEAEAAADIITARAKTSDTATPFTTPTSEAALASLRAIPGAAALQQATISQRKADTATISNATTDEAATTSGESKTALSDTTRSSIFAALVADDFQIAPTGPVADDTAEVVALLPVTSDPETATAAAPATATSTNSTASTPLADASLSSLSRATIETTANLAAQISSRLAGRSTRFELGLTPEGLGRVDVTLDIDSDGQLAARLAFDNPLAATELRGRADELRRQLEDAGFTLARDALDFSSRDNSSGGDRRQQRATAYADRHGSRTDIADLPPAWTVSPSRLTPQGVDVKV